MKILLAATQFYPEFGGIESSIYYIAKTLKELHHEPVILTGRSRTNLPLYENIEGMRVIRYPFLILRNIFSTLRPLCEKKAIDRKLKELLKQEEFGAIWARHPFFVCSAIKVGFKGKLIYIPAMVKRIFEENEILNLKTSLLRKLVITYVMKLRTSIVEYFERQALKVADENIVFSNIVRRMFCDYYKLSKEKIRVIYPGIDISKFKPNFADTNLLRKLNIGEKEKIFIYVGRVSRGKNVDLLLEAFSLLKNTPSVLIIVGMSNELNSLKLLSYKLGISNKVYFVGYQKDTISYYSIADFFVMPSTLEGFGHVFLEAMASGLPCIAFKTNYPKVRVATEEIIIDGKNGFLVDRVNPQSLAEKMLMVLKLSRDEYKRMSEFAHNYAKKFSWRRFINEMGISKEK